MRLSVVVALGVLVLLAGTARVEAGWVTLDFPGQRDTHLFGIDGNKIVGRYGGSSVGHGLLYDGSAWTTLDFPGAIATTLTDIDDGVIVGYYKDASGVYGLLYDGSNWETLSAPGSMETVVTAISGDKMVGWYLDMAGNHGFLYDGREWTTLDFPNVLNTYPYDFDDGTVVGSYFDNGYHGFIYDGTTWVTLDIDDHSTDATGVDGKMVVGSYHVPSKPYGYANYGFLYDGTNWITLRAPNAEDTVPMKIIGQTVVGYYTDRDLNTHGFIYEIPEPATLLLLGLGGTALPRRRKM